MGTLRSVPLLLLACSCAAVFKGSRQSITLQSEPDGAVVTLNGNRIGKTPMEFKANCKDDLYLRFDKPGFETRPFLVTHYVGGGWVALDILLPFYVVNVLVDALTGAWFYFDQEHVFVTLEALARPPPPLEVPPPRTQSEPPPDALRLPPLAPFPRLEVPPPSPPPPKPTPQQTDI